MARVFVSVGSNIDKTSNVRSALVAMRADFGALEVSPVYRSAAVGFEGGDFFNLVVGFDTDLSPQDVVKELHRIEAEHGRKRHEKRFDSRTLDLDLLLYDDLVLDDGDLQLPRSEIVEYAHVLQPLCDLVGNARHPELNVSYAQLLTELNGEGQVMVRVEPELV